MTVGDVLKTYSREEIAIHATERDAWMIIGENVYDLTLFRHTGGFAALASYLGQDGTRRFNRIHTAEHLKVLDAHYLIGKVATESIVRKSM